MKWEMTNGEWGKGNGEWENGEWEIEMGNWKLEIDFFTLISYETSKFFEKGFPTNQNFTILEK